MKKIISIFSGIDCLSLGFSQYFDVVLAVEREKNACATLNFNKSTFHKNLEVIHNDIFQIPDDFILKYKGICGLIGGPPCQPFSPAKSIFDPTDSRILCLTEYIRWVTLLRPDFFMFENTSGLMQKSKIAIFNNFVNEVESLGYDISFDVLNAHDYGSVQNRKRIIVVGFRNDLKCSFKFPRVFKQKKLVKDIIIENEELGECLMYPPKRKRLISFVPEGGNWRDLPNEELKKEALGGNYENRQGGMTGVYKRLSREGYCPTLTTSPLQRNTMSAHPLEDRPLSVKESKRAQGIPDNYTIIGSLTEKYKYIGNGVPVELASAIAKEIYISLNNIL